jgi:hypothetical protein
MFLTSQAPMAVVVKVRMLFIPASNPLVTKVGHMHAGKRLDRQPVPHYFDHRMLLDSVLRWYDSVIQHSSRIDCHLLVVGPQLFLPERLVGRLTWRVPDIDAIRKFHSNRINVRTPPTLHYHRNFRIAADNADTSG